MAHYAVISSATSIVVNLVEWDGNLATWQPPAGTFTILIGAGVRVSVGDTYDGTTFIEPPPRPRTRREELAEKPILTPMEIQEALRILLSGEA